MSKTRIAVIHPDLGIGGAERLIVDLIHAVKKDYDKTSVWTSHFDKNHCFDDTKDLDIKVHGSFIPRSLFGFGHIIFSLISNFIVVLNCIFRLSPDIYIIDQVSAFIPIIRLLRPKAKIVFYCHFPDLRLASRNSLIRKIYRIPFDFIEWFGLKFATLIYVNSKFTASVVKQEFNITNVKVLYPCVDTQAKVPRNKSATPLFVSLNRYERKKDHDLAIKAFAEANKTLKNGKLVIAGGYDTRVTENVEHYKELQSLAEKLNVSNSVELMKSISDIEKWNLISQATCILYTPQNEHFGIVPLEALKCGTPVIACNSGGPCETCDVEGCFLCEPKTEKFAEAMIKVYNSNVDMDKLKEKADSFSFDNLYKALSADLKGLLQK